MEASRISRGFNDGGKSVDIFDRRGGLNELLFEGFGEVGEVVRIWDVDAVRDLTGDVAVVCVTILDLSAVILISTTFLLTT